MKYYFIISVCIIFIGGCTKNWLDKKPQAKLAVPETLTDFQALLDAEGVINISPDLGNVGSDGFFMSDPGFNSTSNKSEKNAYTWTNNPMYTSVNDWNQLYTIVFYCNVVLEGLNKLNPNDDAQSYNNIKGQALFHRARAFYEIAQLWGQPYNSMTVTSDLGIPLRLNSDINIKSDRATIKQTYDQIINDLLVGKALLPGIGLNKQRASRAAVFALLARSFLSMADYDNALKYADSCLNLYNYLIDFKSLNPSASRPIKRANNEVIFDAVAINAYLSTLSIRGQIDSVFYNSYSTNDLRMKVFFSKTGTTIKFKGSYLGSLTNFGGLAVDEIYLIKSECHARNGNTSAAMTNLNTFLAKRYDSTFVPLLAISAEDALSIILKERKKELLFRGTRWTDLRRLNQDPRFAITLNRTVNGNTYSIGPSSFKYTLPIPEDIIKFSGIEQNQGW